MTNASQQVLVYETFQTEGEAHISNQTMHLRTRLYCQLVPSLDMTFALRFLFDIPPRIFNSDENMTSRQLKGQIVDIAQILYTCVQQFFKRIEILSSKNPKCPPLSF